MDLTIRAGLNDPSQLSSYATDNEASVGLSMGPAGPDPPKRGPGHAA